MSHIRIPAGSRNDTRKVLKEVAECQSNGDDYDSSFHHQGCLAKLIVESTNAFEGTDHEHDFFIFHDGLSAWRESVKARLLATLPRCVVRSTPMASRNR